MTAPATSPFGALLRQWRLARRLSQLELAHEAEVSSRHVSFIETGRATPSREMVLALAGVLDVPLRERNALLQAAGYAPVYRETRLEDPAMAEVRQALRLILEGHEPFGAVVMDRSWDILMVNRAQARFLELLGEAPPPAYEVLPAPRRNGLKEMLSPTGLRPLIRNWEEVAPVILGRVRREVMWARDPAQRALVDSLLAQAELPRHRSATAGAASPGLVVPVELAVGGQVLRLFSTIATLGTAQDITLHELRIELFHAADEETRRLARQLAG